MSDAIHVACQHANRDGPQLAEAPSVPDLAEAIVSPAEQNVRRAIRKRHCVHIVLVCRELKKAHFNNTTITVGDLKILQIYR